MDDMIYVAMSGAKQAMIAQEIHANNLANVSTKGFRADFSQARSMPVFGEIYDSRVFAMTETPGDNFESGSLERTGGMLDIAIKGEGWLVVRDDAGQEAFTRAGELFIDTNGILRTRANHMVMGSGGPVTIPPAEKILIAADGTVSVRELGQGADALSQLDRIRLVKPDNGDLKKGLDGLFRRADGLPEPIDGSVRIETGALENSNVNAVSELTSIISLARQFEMQIKLMKSAEEMSAAEAAILRAS